MSGTCHSDLTLIGGMGTFIGPVVGALVIISLENKLGEVGDFLASATGIEWFRAIGGSVTMVTERDLRSVCTSPSVRGSRVRLISADWCPAAGDEMRPMVDYVNFRRLI